ncbi:MAG: hypothetical protein AABY01_00315 [Nanoarchaeota archaeon]
MGCDCGSGGCCGGSEEKMSPAEQVKMLKNYEKELAQEMKDVAAKIKELSKKK